jgi:hypothetical protein
MSHHLIQVSFSEARRDELRWFGARRDQNVCRALWWVSLLSMLSCQCHFFSFPVVLWSTTAWHCTVDIGFPLVARPKAEHMRIIVLVIHHAVALASFILIISMYCNVDVVYAFCY